MTAKDLTEEDHRRLNGGVERVLQKDAPTRDDMLREVSATLLPDASRVAMRAKRRGRAVKILYVEDNDDNIYVLRNG